MPRALATAGARLHRDAGHPLLRRAIAALYDGVGAEEILCFAGAEEAIYVVMRVLLRPRRPRRRCLAGLPVAVRRGRGGGRRSDVRAAPARARSGGLRRWALDLDELRGALRPATRLLVTNFPHNPTGALLSPASGGACLRSRGRRAAICSSDEVYRLLEHDPGERLPAAVDGYERAISLGVMSKPFGLAGLRVGWVAPVTPAFAPRSRATRTTRRSATAAQASCSRSSRCAQGSRSWPAVSD